MSKRPFLVRLGTVVVTAGASLGSGPVHAAQSIAPSALITAASEIKGSNYRVWFDTAEVTVHFEGILRLGPAEYFPIDELLEAVLTTNPKSVTLDVRQLNFLNSSGTNVLYKFAIATRKKGDVQLVVRGSKAIPWQGKSLPNLKKFNQNLELILVD